jgi:hypothetical protein
MNLLNIDQEIELALENSEGEITPEIEELLAEQGERERWLRGCARSALNARAAQAGLKSEIDRLKSLLELWEKKEEKMLAAVRHIGGEEPRDLGFARIAFRSSEAVKIDEGMEGQLPDAYTVATFRPDKKEILKDLKCGATIPHCTLEKRLNMTLK